MLIAPRSPRICGQRNIARLSLFGSILKGTARQNSDIDLLVEFETAKKPGLLGMARIKADIATLIGGRWVDLRTAEDLSPHFRGEVVHSAELQYGA